MCFAYQPNRAAIGKILPNAETKLQTVLLEGVKESGNGFYYPKSTVEVIRAGTADLKAMRWDLIPWNYLKPATPLTLAEAVKRKNSRAMIPGSTKRWGYDSYNARLESVLTTNAFKMPFKNGQRCVMPVQAWRERPNMDGAPVEFTGREFEVHLLQAEESYFLAGLWDTYTAGDGMSIDSCTVITGPSDAIPILQGIYHERTPIVLNQADAEEWLDLKLTPEVAYSFLRGVKAPEIEAIEVIKSPT